MAASSSATRPSPRGGRLVAVLIAMRPTLTDGEQLAIWIVPSYGRQRQAPLAQPDATHGEELEGLDAGSYRRWRHGGADDRSGATGVGRLHDDRRLRADAHAEHRGGGAEHPPERRTAGAGAGRRPRRR